MELSPEQIRHFLEVRHPGQHIPPREKVAVRCGLLDHDDRNPSCTLFLTGNGGVNCHGCGFKGNLFQFEARFSNCSLQQAEINIAQITGAAASPSLGALGPPVAFYDYRDDDGKVLFQKRRYQPPLQEKTFRIFRPVWRGNGYGWEPGIDPKDGAPTQRVLYNEPHLITANVVFHGESEKDVDNLITANLFPNEGWSIAGTCSHAGAWKPGESPKWEERYNSYYTGARVFIFQHNDLQGKTYAEYVAAAIAKYARKVCIVLFSELPEKGDVSDYLELFGKERLEEKIKSAPEWKGESLERENWLVGVVNWVETASPEVNWLIDGVIQADANGIIAAEPKTGKSLCALDLLISLSCGMAWLGKHVPRRVRTAYISREDSPVLTKVRAKGFLRGKGLRVDPSDWLWCNTREQLGNFSIDNDVHLKNMAHDLKERGVEFAVIDVLSRIHNRNENDNTEMAGVVEHLSQMGREAGCSIGLVHHVSKENSSGRFFTRIRGASAIHGWTEWSIGLTLENPNNEGIKLIRRAEFESKAIGESKPILFTVEFDRENLRLQIVDSRRNVDTADREARPRYN